MAKPTRRKGETSTTVSVGIRIDPKIKFALDMMGRQQKRSLTAVIEWAISNAIAQQQTGNHNETFAELIDRVWSTDESTRFANMAFYMPEALTYDELRIWETIKLSPDFWVPYKDGTWEYIPSCFHQKNLSFLWERLLDHVDAHKSQPTVTPYYCDDAPF